MKQTFNPLDKNGFIFFVDEIWKRITNKFNDLSKVAFSGKYTDLTDAPKLKTVAISGSYNDLSDKPTMVSLNNNRIATLNDFSQINKIGFWQISAIDAVYASDIGIERNTGDFHAIVLSYNGDGTNFNFGNIILSSPRLNNDYYLVQMWEKVPHVTYHRANVPSLTNNLLATAPGTALDAAVGPGIDSRITANTNAIDQLNSDFVWKKLINQSINFTDIEEKTFQINTSFKEVYITIGISSSNITQTVTLLTDALTPVGFSFSSNTISAYFEGYSYYSGNTLHIKLSSVKEWIASNISITSIRYR